MRGPTGRMGLTSRRRRGLTRIRLLGLVLLILTVSVASAYVGARYGDTGLGAKAAAGLGKTVPSYAQITIPNDAHEEPTGFNVTELLTGAYRYPFNFTVVIGVNNTIVWLNNDSVDHTVESFVVPTGAASFGSGLIPPKGEFSTTLTVAGVYKYSCIWHPWLSGEVTVKSKA
jgi:plastocyanin